MAEGYLARERERAGQALQDAYEQARVTGYHSGSPQMRRLERAEGHYQQERQRWKRYVGQLTGTEQHVGDGIRPGCGAVDR